MFENEIPRWLFEPHLQYMTANPANLAVIFCLALVCRQKPIAWELNFLHIFAVPLSSRHEKCWQILERFFLYFTNLETYCVLHTHPSLLLKQILRSELNYYLK